MKALSNPHKKDDMDDVVHDDIQTMAEGGLLKLQTGDLSIYPVHNDTEKRRANR